MIYNVLSLVITIAGVVFMARAAEFEDMSPWGWGILTLLVIVAAHATLPWGFLNAIIGLVTAFLVMTIYKMAANK